MGTMLLSALAQRINIRRQCRKLGVSPWSCPQFIFLIMGFVIIGMILVTHEVGRHYVEAEILIVIVLLVCIFLLTASYVIVQAFEQVVHSRRLEAAQAQEIIKLKDEFVFIAAHELRTPANAIKWGLGSLRKDSPALVEEGKEVLDVVTRANERLLFLVKDLLETARLESNTVRLTCEPVRVNAVVEEAVREVEQAHKEQARIEHYTEDVPPVLADPIRLKEVLLNLLTNAVQYGEAGTAVVVTAGVDNDSVTVHVRDEGLGIGEDEQHHVFEKFWRAERVSGTIGTGLGLFITKELVERMGGRIWFESRPGEGTTFSFSLRRTDTADTASTASAT